MEILCQRKGRPVEIPSGGRFDLLSGWNLYQYAAQLGRDRRVRASR